MHKAMVLKLKPRQSGGLVWGPRFYATQCMNWGEGGTEKGLKSAAVGIIGVRRGSLGRLHRGDG